jgi:hypothetical protein
MDVSLGSASNPSATFFILEIKFILKPLISTPLRPDFWGQFLDYLPLACFITYLA